MMRQNHIIYVLIIGLTVMLFRSSSLSASAPANNFCEGAIFIPPDSCGIFTTLDATFSSNPSLSLLCGGITSSDVWFKSLIPASGNLRIETFTSGSGPQSSAIEAYTGDCDLLTPIACNSRKSIWPLASNHGLIELSGLIEGDSIFFRVMTSPRGEFEICAIDSIPTTPCKINLIKLGTTSLCDSASNTFSQELIVDYVNEGNATVMEVYNSVFDLQSSPQTITLDSLPAHGQRVRFSAQLGGSPNDTCNVNSDYFAGSLIRATPNCFNGTVVNDSCHLAILLPTSDTCPLDTFDLTGATRAFASSSCGTLYQDLWFEVVVPNSGEIGMVIREVHGGIFANYHVYSGTCDGLDFILCGTHGGMFRIADRIPGESLYIRVFDRFLDQGSFSICAFEMAPLTNDICDNAINLSLSDPCSTETYSTDGANAEGNPYAKSQCDPLNSSSKDLWFKVIIPQEGEFSLSTIGFIPGQRDMVVEVFRNSCDSLIFLACEAGVEEGQNSILIYGLQQNEEVFIRMSVSGSQSTNAFKICSNVSCPMEFNISGNVNGNFSYVAEQTITTNTMHIVSGSISMNASSSIEVYNELEVDSGALLEVGLVGCDN